jgi:hypothetical protein
VFIERLLIEELKYESMDLFMLICVKQISRLEELQNYFRPIKSELTPSICFFLDTANSYYKMLGLYGVFKKNCYMVETLLPKTKKIEQIYFENNFIGHNILDLKDHFTNLVQKSGANTEFAQYPSFALSFFNDKLERDLKKSISTYDALKGELQVHAFANTTIESLLNAESQATEDDPIVARLAIESANSAAK